jgi:hypothetical protein
MESHVAGHDGHALEFVHDRQRSRSRRVLEFLVVGGATLFLLPLSWLLQSVLGLDASEYAVGFLAFHAAFLLNDPHFAVTYLLFYKDVKRRAFGNVFARGQKLRYWVAGFVVPAVLAGWGIAGLALAASEVIGWMTQLMFFLVGWHYVKQGFGVLTVLSARQGVLFSTLERRVIVGHCLAGWVCAWATPPKPSQAVVEKGIVYTSMPHPETLAGLSSVVFALSAALVGWVLVRKWRSEQRVPPLAGLAGLFVSVWMWSVFSSIDPLMIYIIPGLHSLQYLYFVGLLTRNEARTQAGPPLFVPVSRRLTLLALGAVALGWLLFRGAPDFLDSTFVMNDPAGVLGSTPYLAVLFIFVNVHHYFMDFVIWRRDNPDIRHLFTIGSDGSPG